jgi:beta-mannosidase
MADARKDREYGNRLIQTYMDQWYRTPKDFESYLYVSQVLQAEGVKIGMEAHRRAMPYCRGSLFWQIDDCWPVASWSSIDYFGRWKALHYTARAVYAPVIISPAVTNNDVRFFVVSDRLEPVDATLDITIMDFGGTTVFQLSLPVTVKPNSSGVSLTLQKHELIGTADESRLVMVSRLRGKGGEALAEDFTYFRRPRDLSLGNPSFTKTVSKRENGYAVELQSNTLAKNVLLSCGDDKGFFADNYFDLLPGVKKTIMVSTGLNQKDFEQTLSVISLADSYQQ